MQRRADLLADYSRSCVLGDIHATRPFQQCGAIGIVFAGNSQHVFGNGVVGFDELVAVVGQVIAGTGIGVDITVGQAQLLNGTALGDIVAIGNAGPKTF